MIWEFVGGAKEKAWYITEGVMTGDCGRCYYDLFNIELGLSGHNPTVNQGASL